MCGITFTAASSKSHGTLVHDIQIQDGFKPGKPNTCIPTFKGVMVYIVALPYGVLRQMCFSSVIHIFGELSNIPDYTNKGRSWDSLTPVSRHPTYSFPERWTVVELGAPRAGGGMDNRVFSTQCTGARRVRYEYKMDAGCSSRRYSHLIVAQLSGLRMHILHSVCATTMRFWKFKCCLPNQLLRLVRATH